MRLIIATLAAGVAAAGLLLVPGRAKADDVGCDFQWARSKLPLPTSWKISQYERYLRLCPRHAHYAEALEALIALRNRRPSRPTIRPPPRESAIRLEPPKPSFAPPPPPAAPPPTLLPRVFVDPDGDGQARTVSEALSRVAEGGVIRLGPGHYRETITISRNVKIVGDRDTRYQPVLDGIIVSGNASVVLEAVRVETDGATNAVQVQSGSLDLMDCNVIMSEHEHRPGLMTSVVYASGGRIQIEGGGIGPGGDAAVLATGGARVFVHHVAIAGGGGYGLYATDSAVVTISNSKIGGRNAVVIDSRATLSLNDNDVTGAAGQFVLWIGGNASIELVDNRAWLSASGRVVAATEGNWLRLGAGAAVIRIASNRSGNGPRLHRPKAAIVL